MFLLLASLQNAADPCLSDLERTRRCVFQKNLGIHAVALKSWWGVASAGIYWCAVWGLSKESVINQSCKTGLSNSRYILVVDGQV